MRDGMLTLPISPSPPPFEALPSHFQRLAYVSVALGTSSLCEKVSQFIVQLFLLRISAIADCACRTSTHHLSMSEKAPGPPLRWEVIEMSFLKDIYESDQAIYPAPELSIDRLTSWAAARPEFFLCLRHDDKDQDADLTQAGACYGVIITVPLMKQHWEKLLGMADRDHGDAKHATSEHVFREHHIDAATMFPSSEDQNSVGLHVFHIERFTSFTNACQKTSFTDIALQEIQNRVAKNFPQWTIHGYSGELKN